MRLAGKITASVLVFSLVLSGCGKQNETESWQATGDDALGQVQENTQTDDDYGNSEYFIDQFIELKKEEARLDRNHAAVQMIWNKYADGLTSIADYEQKKDMDQIVYSGSANGFAIEITEVNDLLQKGVIDLNKDMKKEDKYKYLTLSLFCIVENISKYNLNRVVEEMYTLTESKQSEYVFDGIKIRITKQFLDNAEHFQVIWYPENGT